MAVITLPTTAAGDFAKTARFALRRAQDVLRTHAGVSQITSYPDHRWFTTFHVVLQSEAGVRAWSLALDQLSDRDNIFALQPPQSTGPSTGYSGSDPLVAGSDQLGASLDVDGLPSSTAILLAGDFVSFDTTSPGGSTNRQLLKVTDDVTSDGNGDATLNFATPIRQAPANNAAVELGTPTAFFMLSDPESIVDLQLRRRSEFVIEAEERIYP